MKPGAKESFIKQLTKAFEEENIDIDIHSLSDKELKTTYMHLQTVRGGTSVFPYGIAKEDDFLDTLENGQLQFISFRDYHKFGIRRLTLKEYLLLIELAKKNPEKYTQYTRYIYGF